jgi:hypothetical protein
MTRYHDTDKIREEYDGVSLLVAKNPSTPS